jgi:hypothetical protein
MTYDFKCEKSHTTTIVQGIKEETPKTVVCETCGEQAKRDWGGGSSVIIPENFKSQSDLYDDSLANPSILSKRLNAKRPSGREKIYW